MINVHCQVRNFSAMPWDKIDMSLHLEKLLQANQTSLVFLNVVCLAEIQHIQILLSLVWPCWGLNPVTYCFRGRHTIGQSKEHESFQIALWIPMLKLSNRLLNYVLWWWPSLISNYNLVHLTYNEISVILNRLFISINPLEYKVWLSRKDSCPPNF